MKLITEIIHGMMTSRMPSDYWAGVNNSVLLAGEFPELDNSHLVKQRDGRSIWKHTMLVIDALSVKNPITVLSGLFHDLGKYYIEPNCNPSYSRFPGHANKSADIARTKLKEWGANHDFTDSVVRLVSTHMFDIKNIVQDKTIRKFVASVGKDNIDNWFVLRVADSYSYDAHKQYRNNLIEPFKRTVESYLEQQPTSAQPKFDKFHGDGGIQIKGGDK